MSVWCLGPRSASEAGLWQMTTGNRLVVFALTDHPERWSGTLANLSFFMSPAVRDVDRSRTGALLELIGHFRAEYTAFLERHHDSPRPVPPMPQLTSEEEKRAWKAMVDKDLAQQPTWGMEIRRRYAREVAHLAEMNHSIGFWSLVRRTMPRMDEARGWLRHHGMDLHRYGPPTPRA